MKRKNYVSTSLDQYLNENKNITLTRTYGGKEPVVVGSRAPVRNQILAFVSENVKVTKNKLKTFIVSLNEGNVKQTAISMWLKRNEKFFITESRNGVTTYKLSNLGKKLAKRLEFNSELSEGRKHIKSKKSKKDHDFKDDGVKGIYDEDTDDNSDNKEDLKESKEERVERIIESIKEKRATQNRIFESDDEDVDDKDEDTDTDTDEDTDTDTDEDTDTDTDEDTDTDTDEDTDTDKVDDTDVDVIDGMEDTVDDERVEISEFIITVDDVASALEELGELGIDAEEVVPGDDLAIADGEDMDMDLDGGEEEVIDGDDLEGGEDMDLGGDDDLDFDLDLDGDIEGEETPELEEASTEPTEDDEDFEMPDLGDEQPAEELDLGGDDELDMDMDLEGDDELAGTDDLEGGDELEGGEELDIDEAPAENQIKVSADNWEALRGWLESKEVDIEEMFGGEIEVEGEEGIEDEINFDGLEDLPIDGDDDTDTDTDTDEDADTDTDKDADTDTDEDTDKVDDDVDESTKKDDKPKPGQKGVNPFPKK